MRTKPRTIALWSLSIVLAAMFLMSGAGKLANMETSDGQTYDEQFVHWGFPAWFRFPVGLLEIAGAIGLLVPRTRFYAGMGLALVMVGAVVTHLRLAEYAFAIVPLVLASLAGTAAWFAQPLWIRSRRTIAHAA